VTGLPRRPDARRTGDGRRQAHAVKPVPDAVGHVHLRGNLPDELPVVLHQGRSQTGETIDKLREKLSRLFVGQLMAN
jgi:hypothetical protein